MRSLFALLLVANLALFSLQEGYFGHLIPDGREPGRLLEQISPEKLKLLPPDADLKLSSAAALPPAPQVQKTVACVELGGFALDDARRAETQLLGLGLAGRYAQRKSDETAGYIVYLPPFKTRADAERASAELHRIGINDFFVVQENGPYKLAISLGVFRTEEAAKAELTTLSQQGVRNAKTGERVTTVAKVYFQFRNLENELTGRLNEIKAQFPGADVHDCPAPAATAGSSNGT